MIFPLRSRFALKFLYICSLLMVDLVRGAATPFSAEADLSGFMEWPALLIPNLRGGPVFEVVLGILKLVITG